MKQKTQSRRFAANTFWLLAQNIYSMLLSLVVGALSARYLGPSGYGLISYGASFVSFFTALSQLGLDSVMVAELVRAPEKRSSYLGSALVMRLCVSLLSIGAVGVLVYAVAPGSPLLLQVTVLQALGILFQSYEVFYYWFQAELKAKYVVWATMLGLTAMGVWRIVLLATGASVAWFALSTSVQALVILLLTVVLFFRVSRLKLTVCWADCKFLLRKSGYYIVTSVAVTLYMQMDRIMLGAMVGEEVVGQYTIASNLAAMWEFIPVALINSARPLIVSERGVRPQIYRQRLQWLWFAVSALGLCVGVAFLLLGGFVVHILYGAAYAPAVPLLSILVWSAAIAMIGVARGIWLVAEDYNRYSTYCTLLGTLANLGLNFLLIPRIGAVGAAAATLVSQIVVVFVSPLLFRPTRAFLGLYVESFGRANVQALWREALALVQKRRLPPAP